jgi:SAM-dependent methyltransferase
MSTNGQQEFGELERYAPSPNPTITERLTNIGFALIGLGVLILGGVYGSIKKVLIAWSKGEWHDTFTLNPLKWRDAITANGIPALLKGSDTSNGPFKRTLIFPNAYGNVLEVGAGTGATLKYYNPQKVNHIYLMEPCIELHDELRQSIAALPDLKGKTTILSCGIEDSKELQNAKVLPGTLDTICLVQVLCSIHQPEKHISMLHSLLKSGGQLLLFEHVISLDPITIRIQKGFTTLIWKHIAGNCHLTRDPSKMFSDQASWKNVSLTKPKGEGGQDLFPHQVAHYIKV